MLDAIATRALRRAKAVEKVGREWRAIAWVIDIERLIERQAVVLIRDGRINPLDKQARAAGVRRREDDHVGLILDE